VVSNNNTSPNTNENANDPADDQNHRADDPRPDAATARSPAKPGSERSDSDNAYKHWLDYAVGIFAFIAAIGGVAAAIFSGWQAIVANQALVVSNRPWISVEPKLLSGLSYDSTGDGHITIGFDLKNVGHSPADIITPVSSKFFIRFGGHPKINETQREWCAAPAYSGTGSKYGFTLFPDETSDAEQVSQLIERNDVAILRERVQTDNVVPVLLGCVKYTFVFDSKEHHTGFIRHLRWADPASSYGRIDPAKGNIPKEQLRLDKLVAPGPAD